MVTDKVDKSDDEKVESIDEDGQLDPRIEIKLEELNKWTDKINTLESRFEESNTLFRDVLTESTDRLKTLASKMVKSIEKCRPYYEARDRLIEIQTKCQRAAINYEKAFEAYLQAKERIQLAERKFNSDVTKGYYSKHQPNCGHCYVDCEGGFDITWQEMLNQANIKLMEAELMKKESEQFHQQSMKDFQSTKMILLNLERKLARDLQRSKVYFDEKRRFQNQLSLIKENIELTLNQLNCAKSRYSSTLKELELISEEIHRKRGTNISLKCSKGQREPGDGAESTDCTTNQDRIVSKDNNNQPTIKSMMNKQHMINRNLIETPQINRLTKQFNNNNIDSSQNKTIKCSCKHNRNHYRSDCKSFHRSESNDNFLTKLSKNWYLHYSDNFGPIYCNLILK